MKNSTLTPQKQQHRFEKYAGQADINDFSNLLNHPELLKIIEDQMPAYRDRHYTPTHTLSMFLGQVMNADSSCQNAVNEENIHRIKNGLAPLSSHTGAYCIARKRLPTSMIDSLTRETGGLLEDTMPPGWRWRGYNVKLVDGTTILLPATEDNLQKYPQHGNQSPGAGFPLMRLVGVISLASGAMLDAAMGPHKGKGTGEHGLFREIRDHFCEGDLMLADSYYCSYFLIADLLRKGVDIVFEQHGARKTDFRLGKRLGPRDHLVQWKKPAKPSWMSDEEYESYSREITVREMRVNSKILVTTVLSSQKIPKNALGEFYCKRWHVELDIRNIKTTVGAEMLSCKTSAMCEKEMWVYFLAYNLIRLLMCGAAKHGGMQPRELSFKHTLQVWVAWRRTYPQCKRYDIAELYLLIVQIRVGKRPGRVEPRAVKRRPKPYPRLKQPRQKEREKIEKQGHSAKLPVN